MRVATIACTCVAGLVILLGFRGPPLEDLVAKSLTIRKNGHDIIFLGPVATNSPFGTIVMHGEDGRSSETLRGTNRGAEINAYTIDARRFNIETPTDSGKQYAYFGANAKNTIGMGKSDSNEGTIPGVVLPSISAVTLRK